MGYYIIEKEISEKKDSLPHIQDVGSYMQKFQGFIQSGKSLNVVTMKICINNFYSANGDDESLRQYDEAKDLESQAEIADKFLQIVQGLTYEINGEVVDFLDDQIIACFPAQVIKGDQALNIMKALHASLKIFY